MERNFDIITDSCCGMPQEFTEANEIAVLPLGYTVDGKTYGGAENETLPLKELYARLRAGSDCHTFQVTAEQARPQIEKSFKKGRDVLIVAFSSALSGTASSFTVAANELTELYPDRKAYVLDSLSGSMGQGMLIEYLIEKAEAGATFEEVCAYGEKLKRRIQHLFTVDDLEFLRKGGRISGAVAVVGKLLKIKPLLHATAKGTLAPIAKIVGRKRSLEALADEAKKRAELSPEDPIFIAHGDCEEEALRLQALLEERLGKRRFLINYMDPVMGTHGGPGIIAVFFKGKIRE
mgnify:FL=1